MGVEQCRSVALTMVNSRSAQPVGLTAGLRKLLEAKDCFVRQAVIDARSAQGPDPLSADEVLVDVLRASWQRAAVVAHISEHRDLGGMTLEM